MTKTDSNCYFQAGTDRTSVQLVLFDTGGGLVGHLTGGEAPHVGGVVLALPRDSLSGSECKSCDIYSIPVPGHLDNEVGRIVAAEICKVTGCAVSITSGIHIDMATQKELETIEQNCRLIIGEYIEKLETR